MTNGITNDYDDITNGHDITNSYEVITKVITKGHDN